MLQSSSPSYVLMSSIDSCIDMLENRRKELFDPYVKMLEKMRGRLRQLKRLELVETESERLMVRNTDNGKKIKEDIEGLKMLLRAYRSGDFDV